MWERKCVVWTVRIFPFNRTVDYFRTLLKITKGNLRGDRLGFKVTSNYTEGCSVWWLMHCFLPGGPGASSLTPALFLGQIHLLTFCLWNIRIIVCFLLHLVVQARVRWAGVGESFQVAISTMDYKAALYLVFNFPSESKENVSLFSVCWIDTEQRDCLIFFFNVSKRFLHLNRGHCALLYRIIGKVMGAWWFDVLQRYPEPVKV